MNINFKEIKIDELRPDMLQGFNRFQHVENDWHPDGSGGYYLVYQPHDENWSEARKREKVTELYSVLENGGRLYGAYDQDALVGFCCIGGVLLGSEKQYLELTWFHVSYEYRDKKIGKRLFSMCAEAAKESGCKKLYIVASSSEESQKAYHKLGCAYAKELIPHLYEDRPLDVHMEFLL